MIAVDLGELAPYDDATSLDMTGARALLRGRYGSAALEVVRRYANPRRGCRPMGPDGPMIVLPAVKSGGRLRTMRQWCEAFTRAVVEATRRELIRRANTKRLPLRNGLRR